MCPDRQILSLYHDGELPSPWKEKLETHLASCGECVSRLEGYRCLSRVLTGDTVDDGLRVAAQERVRRGLRFSRPARAADRTGRLWSRRVSIPLPAAAAVAAVLAVAFAFALRSRAVPSVPAPDTLSAMGLDVPAIAYPEDMDGVLRYLGDTDTGDMVIIRLPESKRFTSSGEPAIIKAADYSRSRLSQ